MLTEADTCRKFVVPKLQTAGWDNEPCSIAEQRTITDGRIVPVGKGFVRKPSKKVDYLLRYRRDFPLAVVEAKVVYKSAEDAVQQARQYAEMLGLKFAYATNGGEIIECDYFTGRETKRPDFPTPGELWERYQAGKGIKNAEVADRLLTPINYVVGKGERYYQQIAINRAVEAILGGDQRLLITMATGTGKTAVAFQICWKLWSARWNRTGEYRRPRILYLADRNILIDQPKDGIFAAFGDARFKIESGEVVQSREMYFAIYQALAEGEGRAGLFKAYQPDFFDLVIVDECHRGSARDDSSWRAILNYFAPAYQLGMTATPLRDDNRDTYLYFGNPIYEYSLRQGIDDGFLAPYRVHRVISEWDAAGWRPSRNDVDRLLWIFGPPDSLNEVGRPTTSGRARVSSVEWSNQDRWCRLPPLPSTTNRTRDLRSAGTEYDRGPRLSSLYKVDFALSQRKCRDREQSNWGAADRRFERPPIESLRGRAVWRRCLDLPGPGDGASFLGRVRTFVSSVRG